MFFTFKLKTPGIKFILIFLAALAVLGFFLLKPEKKETFSRNETEACLVIDPGHGGIDGGAVALSGEKESDINLAIGLRLNLLARFCGLRTVMSRYDDNINKDPSVYSEHEDLVYRAELANETPNACLISIHQNFYPTSQPGGAQVLYASSAGSRELGLLTHKNIVSYLQPENRRLAAPAAKELYITSHINCPGILVECGFMSNFSDLQKLCQDDYQNCFAAVLLGSYLQYKNAYT